MPIKPENLKFYPENWPEIRERIRKRSGNRCECTGECGEQHEAGRCNLEHMSTGYRLLSGKFVPAKHFTPELAASLFGQYRTLALKKIVLTVSHKNHVPSDCEDSNLQHFCQRCHLLYDREHHLESARKTRMQKAL